MTPGGITFICEAFKLVYALSQQHEIAVPMISCNTECRFSVHWTHSLKIYDKRAVVWKSLYKYVRMLFSMMLYIKSCMWGYTAWAYLNAKQQCPLTSGWTMLNSLCLIRWLTLQRIQGHSLICHWGNGGQTHRISSTHWVLQVASESVCMWDCSMFPRPQTPCKPQR